MRMLMAVLAESKKEEFEVLLSRVGVEGYTELAPAAGMGSSGPRHGSRAFPGTSAVVFSILSEARLEELSRRAEEFCQECGDEVRLVSWPVDVLR